MADICPVCNKKISLLEGEPQPGIYTHPSCEATFLQNPEKLNFDFWGKKIWMLLNIEIWHREVVEK